MASKQLPDLSEDVKTLPDLDATDQSCRLLKFYNFGTHILCTWCLHCASSHFYPFHLDFSIAAAAGDKMKQAGNLMILVTTAEKHCKPSDLSTAG